VFFNAAWATKGRPRRDPNRHHRHGICRQVGFGSYIRDIRVLELPFLYKDFDEIHRVYAKISPILSERFAAKGVQLLGYVYEGRV